MKNALFRMNSNNFDRIDVTLGFGDLKDARQFTAAVASSSFSGVNISLTPMIAPPDGKLRAGGH